MAARSFCGVSPLAPPLLSSPGYRDFSARTAGSVDAATALQRRGRRITAPHPAATLLHAFAQELVDAAGSGGVFRAVGGDERVFAAPDAPAVELRSVVLSNAGPPLDEEDEKSG